MTRDDAVGLATSMADAWNARDLHGFLSFLTDDVVWDDPAMSAPAAGREAVEVFSRAVLRAFPDFHYEIRGPICAAADGSRVAVPWRITGTHSELLDPPGWSPTNRRAAFEGLDLLELRDGQVSRIDTYFNVVVAAEQLLGVTLRPAPGSTRERMLVALQAAVAAVVRGIRRDN